MSQTVNFSFKPDSDAKRSVQQIPCADPFYSESNMAHLRRGIAALNAGKAKAHAVSTEEDTTAAISE